MATCDHYVTDVMMIMTVHLISDPLPDLRGDPLPKAEHPASLGERGLNNFPRYLGLASF